jgi:hypothetical protein
MFEREPGVRVRKLYRGGSLSAVRAGNEAVPASELSDALKQISPGF